MELEPLLKKRLQRDVLPLLLCKDTVRGQQSAAQKRATTRRQPTTLVPYSWTSSLWNLELWETFQLFTSYLIYGILLQ